MRNTTPVRYMARKPFKCDACMRMVPKGDRLCSLGQFRTCRDCEHTLPARFELWLDRHSDWSRKLDMNQAVEVRTLYDAGQHTYAQLAEMFGVNATTIGDIARGRRYQDAI